MSTAPDRQEGIRSGPPEVPPTAAATAPAKRGPNWLFLGIMGALLIALAFLGIYQLLLKNREFYHPEKIKELQTANLDPVTPKEKKPAGPDGKQWVNALRACEAATITLSWTAFPPPALFFGALKPPPLILERFGMIWVREEVIHDWPQWRGPNRDGVSPESAAPWPESGPKILWEKELGPGYSSVVVADQRVFTLFQDGDHEVAACIHEDGKELWRYRYPSHFRSEGEGPRSTPAVDGAHVYTVGALGFMHCLKTKNGEVVWKRHLLQDFQADNLQWGTSFSPLVVGDLVFTNPGGRDGNSLVALDKYTGKVRWKALDDQAGYSSPVFATHAGKPQVVFFTALGLVGVTPDTGELLWRFPWETSYGCNIATPIVAGDYLFISSGYNRGCAVLKIEADADGKLQAHRVYENHSMHNHFSSSVRFKDHLYGFDEVELRCVDLRSGKIAWRQKGLRKGSLLLAGDTLILLGEFGKLALAEANPKGYRELASYQVTDTKCWVAPVLANGRLYVRDQERLRCLDLRKK